MQLGFQQHTIVPTAAINFFGFYNQCTMISDVKMHCSDMMQMSTKLEETGLAHDKKQMRNGYHHVM